MEHMFYSILFPEKKQHDAPRRTSPPDYFKDLNLDQIFTAYLMEDKEYWRRGKEDEGLESFLYTPLDDPDIITFRQEVLRELEDDGLRTQIAGFVETLKVIQGFAGSIQKAMTAIDNTQDNYLTRGQMLDCTEMYCRAVTELHRALSGRTLRSRGLSLFSQYLATYAASEAFTAMRDRAARLREEFAAIECCLMIKDATIRMRPYECQKELVSDIRETFSIFCPEDGVWENRLRVIDTPPDLQTEAALLKMAAKLNKETFGRLDEFCSAYGEFADVTLLRFSREVRFYLIWLDFIRPLEQGGLPFCYPKLAEGGLPLYSRGGFDLSLACKKSVKPESIVPNDFELRPPERILVVTGPNQGGKTTFARAFGQMHHLAALGLSVPGRDASLRLFDHILTHFEREEELASLSGKLQDDLLRLRELLDRATDGSIVVINEIFASTTLADALTLGRHMMDALVSRGAAAVVVTFLDELAQYGPETVSMMSTVREDDPACRTYKIVRKPPDGLAYAMHLARKHRLTYEQLSKEYAAAPAAE
jgi:DNA mismatch repair protein MutS